MSHGYAKPVIIVSEVLAVGTVKFSAGTYSTERSDITFANSHGVSFGLETNGFITASVDPTAAGLTAIKLSAGTLSTNRSDFTFHNGNGVSFGLDSAGAMTATVATNYQSFGAYLTTAALSGDTSKYAGTSAGITGGSITVNTAGVAISLPSYLTTAQPPGAYLTTAALSQDSSRYAGINGAITGGSLTVNTSGISINLPAYLTTAMGSNQGSNFVQATAVFSGTNISGTIASGGITISAPLPGVQFFAGTLANFRTNITFSNANGVSFGLESNGVITATVATNYQSAGAYLTTAALSQDSSKYAGTSTGMTGGSVTLNTSGIRISLPAYLTTAGLSQDSSKYAGTAGAITGGSLTVNTAGVSINLPAYLTTAQPPGAYLTTAMASNRGSDFVQATAAFAGTNASGTIASGGISISVAAPGVGGGGSVNFSAGTTSSNRSDITFADSNGVSFGLNTNGVITATVATNYQSTGAYLTTAALSQDSSKYAGTAGAITGGSITVNTAGVSVNLPAYLTTAMASNRGTDFVQATAAFAGTNASGTIASSGISISVAAAAAADVKWSAGTLSSNRSDITFGNSNGVSFGLNTNGVLTATVATNYQSQGAYLTTAALSQDSSKYAGTVGAITGGSITVNTAGVSVNLPAYLTTAQPPGAYLTTAGLSQDSSKYAGTSTGMAGGSVTLNTSGISISLPAYLTTAALSGDTTKYAGVGETTSTQAGTALGLTVNTVGVSILYPNWLTTAQSPGAYLTTAALSQDSSKYAGTSTGIAGGSVTLNTSGISISLPAYLTTAALSADSSKYAGTAGAITGGSITVNTSGVSVNLPAYLTTAMASNSGSNFVQATAAFAGTNASGTIASGGISISVNPGGGGAGTGFTSTSTTGSVIVGTLSTNGLSMGVPAYLTTAGRSQDSSKYAGTSTAMVGGSVTLNTAGINILLPAYLTTSTAYPWRGPWVTATAYAVNDCVESGGSSYVCIVAHTSGVFATDLAAVKWNLLAQGAGGAGAAGTGFTSTSTAGANIVGTLSSNGLSMGVPAYLTTAMASNRGSDFVQGTAAFAGTNASGTIGSAGISISVNPAIAGGGAGTGFTTATTAGTAIVGTLGAGGLSMGVPAYLTDGGTGGGGAGTVRFLEPYSMTNTVAFAPVAGSWYLAPFVAPGALSGGRINFLHQNTSTAQIFRDITGVAYQSNSTGTLQQSYTYEKRVALWSQGTGALSNNLESFWSGYFSFGWSKDIRVSLTGVSQIKITVGHTFHYISDIDSNGQYGIGTIASSISTQIANSTTQSHFADSVASSIRNIVFGNIVEPFGLNTLVTAGNYWLGFAWSTTRASAATGTGLATALDFSVSSEVGISRLLLETTYRNWGSSVTTARSHIMPYGVIVTAATMNPPQYIELQSGLSSLGSAWIPYFNFQAMAITTY